MASLRPADLKLGKLPWRDDPRTLQFHDFVPGPPPPGPPPPGAPAPAPPPVVPDRFGHDTGIADWGMLGNGPCPDMPPRFDGTLDCVVAGAAHETMLWTHEHGAAAGFDSSCVLADYTRITGYDPSRPETDRGTVVLDALNYRRRTGVADAAGRHHRIGAFAALRTGDWDQLLHALYLFGAVGLGFKIPKSALTQFVAEQPWTVVRGSPNDGGHYVSVVAKREQLVCVSWGREQLMTREFLETYTDEAYALLSPEHLEDGVTLEGFDLAALKQRLATITA